MLMRKKKKMDFSIQAVELGLKILHLNVSEETKHLLVQIFKFGIVGVIATVIDFVFLYFFKEFCRFPVVLANTLSFIFSVLYNYWASLTFVFDVNQGKDKRRRFIIFMVCSVIGLGLSDFIVWIITDTLNIYYLISKLIATAIVMAFNFITRKKFLE